EVAYSRREEAKSEKHENMSEENQKLFLAFRIGHWSGDKTVMAETHLPSILLKKEHSATRNSRFVELEA
ncbi:unnamed protein product, partial [Bubo scandiacus]